MVQPCQLIYSTLRPTKDFVRQAHPHITPQPLTLTLRPTKDFGRQAHPHITAPYLLITP
jgi:hypothetical protein